MEVSYYMSEDYMGQSYKQQLSIELINSNVTVIFD
jgi:hypothetical protein